MPIYEYVCSKCGKPFEYFARSLSDVAKSCPVCGAKRPKKALSTFQAKSHAASSAGCDPASCEHAAHGHGCGCGCGCCH